MQLLSLGMRLRPFKIFYPRTQLDQVHEHQFHDECFQDAKKDEEIDKGKDFGKLGVVLGRQ